MGNSLKVPDGSVYETIDPINIRDNLQTEKKDKKKVIKSLRKRVQEVTEQLLEEEAKLEAYKKQNKNLAVMISILKAKEITQKEEAENMQILKCLLPFLVKYQSSCSSIEFKGKETLV
jgi:lipoate-protein ligase A